MKAPTCEPPHARLPLFLPRPLDDHPLGSQVAHYSLQLKKFCLICGQQRARGDSLGRVDRLLHLLDAGPPKFGDTVNLLCPSAKQFELINQGVLVGGCLDVSASKATLRREEVSTSRWSLSDSPLDAHGSSASFDDGCMRHFPVSVELVPGQSRLAAEDQDHLDFALPVCRCWLRELRHEISRSHAYHRVTESAHAKFHCPRRS